MFIKRYIITSDKNKITLHLFVQNKNVNLKSNSTMVDMDVAAN